MVVRSAGVLALVLGALWGTAAAEPVTSGSAVEWGRFAELEASAGDFGAGVAAQRRGDLAAARDAFAAAIAKDPSFVEALANLARVQVALGDFDAAAATLDAAAAQRSDYPGVHAARGLLALERGDAELAVDALTRAREATPDDVETLANLGAALLVRGMNEPALAVLERAQRLDPQRAAVVFNLGLAHDREGEFARALHHYRRYLALSPRLDPYRAKVERRVAELTGANAARLPVSEEPPHSRTDAAPAVIGGTER